MGEIVREEQHLVTYSLRLDEAAIRLILAQHLADQVAVNLGRRGVTSQVLVREVGAQGVTAVEVVADVTIAIDELERAMPIEPEVAHG